MAGATLSGWPSSSAASCSSSFFVAGVDRSLPPRARPAARPETRAAEELPIPRVGGTEFWHSKCSGTIGCPTAARPFSTHLTIRLSGEGFIRSAPSPSMVIENLSARVTTSRLYTFIASPSESKPGPMLAVVAGTCTSTRSTVS